MLCGAHARLSTRHCWILRSGSGSVPCPVPSLTPCRVLDLSCGTDDAESVKPRSFLTFRGAGHPTASTPAPRRRNGLACIVNVRSAGRVMGQSCKLQPSKARHDVPRVICSGPSDPVVLHAHDLLAPDRLSPCEPAGLASEVDTDELENFEACPSDHSPFYNRPHPTPVLGRQVPADGGKRDGLVMSPARAQQTSSSAIVFSRLKQPTQAQTQSQMRPANTQPTTPTQLNSTHFDAQVCPQVLGLLGDVPSQEADPCLKAL